jgi:GDP-L-fucose synthase
MTIKNVLVCGGTGFIGHNLVIRFASQPTKYRVTATYLNSDVFAHENVTWVKADLREKNQVDALLYDADIVFQAAATTSGASDIVNTPEVHVTDNAIMNSQILRSVLRNKISNFIFFSCTTMYSTSTIPQAEHEFDANLEVFPSYFGVAWTKFYIEKMCEFYSKLCDTKFSVIRHSNIYGPWDKFDLKRSHVMGATITKVLDAKEEIEVWGKGIELRDLLYIDDLVDLVEVVTVRQTSKFELFNAGSGTGISIKNLVSKVIEISGKTLRIVYNESKPNLVFSFVSNNSKVQELFGWKASISLEDGIKRTIDWRMKNESPIDHQENVNELQEKR